MGLLFFPTYKRHAYFTPYFYYATVALQKIQVQKRQKDIHPAQTQHNTQQENSTRVKLVEIWC